ncbi:MAG: hypothetical protein JXA33_06625 [Anaerolineae bacterium]|nr:hypothetical protein [Anaerolineae bacterium]
MTALAPDPGISRFIRPTVDTPFHIDYGWWEKQGLDLNIQLTTHLCPEHRNAYAGQRVEMIDWVDPDTCEVKQIDGLQYIITTHCSRQPGYVMGAPTILEAIFRVFLSNGNQPLSPRKISPLVGQPGDRILNLLSGRKVHKGLRPVLK